MKFQGRDNRQRPKYIKTFYRSIYPDVWILERQKEMNQLKLWR